jgi:hypothetical protein
MTLSQRNPAIVYVPEYLPEDRIYKAGLLFARDGFRTADGFVNDGMFPGHGPIHKLISPDANDIEKVGLNPLYRPAGERRYHRIDSQSISQRPENKVRRTLPLVGLVKLPVKYRAGVIDLRVTPVQDLDCNSTRGFEFLAGHYTFPVPRDP